MLNSRAIALGRAISNGLKMKLAAGHNNQIVRNSSQIWFYRTGNTKHSKRTLIMAEGASAFMWWWFLWHLWHEPEHLFVGEFGDYVDPSKWTNAELGVPPDDYEE